MSEAHLSTANYSAVIADLRAKRDELDRAIELLEKVAAIQVSLARDAGSVPVRRFRLPSPTVSRPSEPPAQSSKGNTPIPAPSPKAMPTPSVGIGEVCVKVLREAGKPLSTREVTDAVLATGFQINTANPVNNVWSALSHRMKATRPDISRNGRDWVYSADYTEAELQTLGSDLEMNGSGQYSRHSS